MNLHRKRQFVHGTVVWMLATVFLLVLVDSLSLQLFFIISLVGFLVLVQLVTPVSVTPQWQRRLRWVILAGLVVFAYVVITRVLSILPPEVL